MKKVDGKWKWQCPQCEVSNSIPVDISQEELVGNRVECPNCSSGYLIDKGLNLRAEGHRGMFLATAAMKRGPEGWQVPDQSEMKILLAEVRAAAIERRLEIVEEYPEHRSVAVRCSPAQALLLSKDTRVCAVAPMETQ